MSAPAAPSTPPPPSALAAAAAAASASAAAASSASGAADADDDGGLGERASAADVLRALHASPRLSVFACTFNMQGRAAPADLSPLLHPGGAARRRRRHHVYAFGSEECGAGIARALVAFSPPAERWAAALGAALGPDYVAVAQASLAATHLIVFAHAALAPIIGDVQSGSVATGFGNAVGNKGGVGVGFNVGKTALLFVNCHLAAHAKFVARRNADLLRVEEALPLAPGGFSIEARIALERRLEAAAASAAAARAASASQQQHSSADEDEDDEDREDADEAAAAATGAAGGRGATGRGASGSSGGGGGSGGGRGEEVRGSDAAAPGATGGSGAMPQAQAQAQTMVADSSAASARALPPGSGKTAPPRTSSFDLRSLLGRREPLPPRVSDRYDRVVWMGDLNYRIALERDAVDALLARRVEGGGDGGGSAGGGGGGGGALEPEALAALVAADQLNAERAAGRIFPGFQEGALAFAPTFKFDKGVDVYDSGPKRRVPSWTDRVLFKSRAERAAGGGAGGAAAATAVAQQQQQQQQQQLMRAVFYGSVAEVRISDHRPVVAELLVALRGAVGAPRLAPPALQPVLEAVSTALASLAAAASPTAHSSQAQARARAQRQSRSSAAVVPVDESGKALAPAPKRERACTVM